MRTPSQTACAASSLRRRALTDRLRKVQRIYDTNPGAYHRGMCLTDRLIGARRRKVGEIVRGRVLDVGFGTGLSLAHYPSDVDVVGIDVSPAMLAYARGTSALSGRRVSLAIMNAERMGFPDRTFDSVAFNLCLCTIPEPDLAVREAVRVAKPGAPMVFLEHVRSHLAPVALLQEALNPVLVALQEDHFNRRTLDVVRRAGVEVQSVDRWLLGFFNLIVGRAPG